MDDLVKQRLVGAVVLALIALVLIPWMFGSPKDPRMTIQPSFSGTPVPHGAGSRSGEVALIEPAPSAETDAQPQPTPRRFLSEPVTAPPQPSASAPAVASPPTQAWLLQLASYRERKAADDFRSRLSRDGYVSYREQVSVGGKTYYRVRMKVSGSKAQAESVMASIEKKYRLQAKLLPAR